MQQSATILLVEDDPDVGEAVAESLADVGYRVVRAANGAEALRALENGTRPALILLDLMMPVMDGWQFREEQRKNPAIADIPVVALSAHGDLRSVSAVAHLRKPVALDTLYDTVARIVKAR
jgi:CheY-like chemotaxis protein